MGPYSLREKKKKNSFHKNIGSKYNFFRSISNLNWIYTYFFPNSPFNWRSIWINVDSPFNTSWLLFRFNLPSEEHEERICYGEGWTVYDPGRIRHTLDCHVIHTLDCHVIHTRDFHVIHSKLIWSSNSHWNKTSTQTFHKITYNTIILTRRVITFLDLNCLLYHEGSLLFRLYFNL